MFYWVCRDVPNARCGDGLSRNERDEGSDVLIAASSPGTVLTDCVGGCVSGWMIAAGFVILFLLVGVLLGVRNWVSKAPRQRRPPAP